MRIGVLAVQGAFIEHIRVLKKLGANVFEIRQLKDIEKPFDGLVLPGGESTTQSRLLKDLGLWQPLKTKILEGDRKSTRLNSSHPSRSRMPSSA